MKSSLRLALMAAALTVGASALGAADGKLMHCFLYTPLPNISDADWKAFYAATDALPSKIPTISKVWYGKLQRPMPAGESVRQYGVCMEFANEAALKSYEKDPAHVAWLAAYTKVRVEGTTTFNLITGK